jgi:hypothetical protein
MALRACGKVTPGQEAFLASVPFPPTTSKPWKTACA